MYRQRLVPQQYTRGIFTGIRFSQPEMLPGHHSITVRKGKSRKVHHTTLPIKLQITRDSTRITLNHGRKFERASVLPSNKHRSQSFARIMLQNSLTLLPGPFGSTCNHNTPTQNFDTTSNSMTETPPHQRVMHQPVSTHIFYCTVTFPYCQVEA